jgi:V/A-type H+/Na+-transporting ATPase subunit K
MTPTSRASHKLAALSRSLLVVLVLIVAALATWLALAARPAVAADQAAAGARLDPQFAGWALVAAALSTALAALGAGYAVGRVGSAAVGAIAEKPELFGRVLVLVGLAEGIAIYGLIVSILILNRLG